MDFVEIWSQTFFSKTRRFVITITATIETCLLVPKFGSNINNNFQFTALSLFSILPSLSLSLSLSTATTAATTSITEVLYIYPILFSITLFASLYIHTNTRSEKYILLHRHIFSFRKNTVREGSLYRWSPV